MALKKFKPTTPGRRQMSVASFEQLTTSKPTGKTVSKKSNAGRNNTGRLTVRHRGGGHKRRYRVIDFDRTAKLNIPGKVTAIEYDPNRTAYIMLVTYVDGDKRYHIAPEGIQLDDQVITAKMGKIKKGSRYQLRNIPVGYSIYNIELIPGKGGQIVRSAGASAKLVSLEGPYAQVQMTSSEIRLFQKDSYATIGEVSNAEHSNLVIGKAGRMRWMGRRPQVRGKAMNPIDHPHGGGEGGSPIGLIHPKTPWGAPALGHKTRRRKETNKWIVKRRKK
ncbi:50S ribosomal protein L2 [Candidatus Peregrinibacteria bacterium CG11_big_fil_rev_8_21_14_0_20_41_10]|nr:MAG: 50S ribosomal protein L2 [Candidatus Peregrinibacteria bacterium CG11_big_fil_rev_8_21_14_0_20_41_10]PIZ76761.1 MAG: 50S ribosomal protein L2 [Candidatus Peregrinibacteria bacterium CG_4_10_14_0_2_um_filter_41_8]PJC37964.1 MAG: 50S ribosomal protein L2 [Candidatus Peregrinibacteria bacterium CG_4_9_14_0_2_um_filter_41_14]